MQKTKLTENTQFYIRFKIKPTTPEPSDELNYVNYGGEWIRSYKSDGIIGMSFISEASWETNWFNRNPEVLKMILINDKDIAKKVEQSHRSRAEIAFLASSREA